MTQDQRDPKAGASGAPRKRPTPTIDLTATEIPDPQAGAKPEPGADTHFTSSQDDAGNKAAGTTMQGLLDRFPVSWPAVAAVAGAFIVFLAGWWAGGMSSDYAASDRLVRLETQLQDKAGGPTVLDNKSAEEISLRLARLEASLKAAADNATARERRLDEIAVAAREAKSRADSAADNAQKAGAGAGASARADLEVLTARIAALEQSTRMNESELARRSTAADDSKSRLAIAASALRDTVERGGPFSAELAAAKSLAGDATALAPLEFFAATGVPAASALAQELLRQVPALFKATVREPRNGGFLDRLQANAEKLVRVRPVGDVAGDAPDRIVARIEAKAAASDIEAALAELARLPAPMRAPAEAWIKKAQAREAALASARLFAQGALAAIGKSGS